MSDGKILIEALLFDLGNVLIKADFDCAFRKWAEISGVDEQTIRSRHRFDESYQQHERATISASEFFGSLRETLAIDLTEDQFASGWREILRNILPDVEPILSEAARHVPMYIFSNTNKFHVALFQEKYGVLLSKFAKVFTSSDLGLRKPDADAFRAVISEIGVKPDRIMFFDDLEENVEGAKAVGMQATLVRATHDIVTALARCTLGRSAVAHELR